MKCPIKFVVRLANDEFNITRKGK